MYNIAFFSSDYYIKFVSVCITSIIHNLDLRKSFDTLTDIPKQNGIEQQKFIFHIFSDHVAEETRNKLETLELELNKFLTQNKSPFSVNIKIHIIPDDIFHGQPKWRGTYITYYRLKLSTIYDDSIEKVLCLDGDTLVNCDIRELFSFDLQDRIFLMVPNNFHARYSLESRTSETAFQFSQTLPYYNAGVMLINLKKWMSYNIEEKALDFLRKYIPRAPEQDALNAIIQAEISLCSPLEYKWNVMENSLFSMDTRIYKDESKNFNTSFTRKEYEEGSHNPCIIHYAKKPWDSRGLIVSNKYQPLFYPHHDLWWAMASKTPAFQEELENIQKSSSFIDKVNKEEELAHKLMHAPYSWSVLWFRFKRETRPFMRKIEAPFKRIRNKKRSQQVKKSFENS